VSSNSVREPQNEDDAKAVECRRMGSRGPSEENVPARQGSMGLGTVTNSSSGSATFRPGGRTGIGVSGRGEPDTISVPISWDSVVEGG